MAGIRAVVKNLVQSAVQAANSADRVSRRTTSRSCWQYAFSTNFNAATAKPSKTGFAPRAASLLAYLTLHPERAHLREEFPWRSTLLGGLEEDSAKSPLIVSLSRFFSLG